MAGLLDDVWPAAGNVVVITDEPAENCADDMPLLQEDEMREELDVVVEEIESLDDEENLDDPERTELVCTREDEDDERTDCTELLTCEEEPTDDGIEPEREELAKPLGDAADADTDAVLATEEP